MFNLIIGDAAAGGLNVVLVPVSDAAGDPGLLNGTPPTYPVDTTGIVAITPSADGLSAHISAKSPGTCNVTPTAVASNGMTITGSPIQITVTAPPPPPPPPATSLREQITVGAA